MTINFPDNPVLNQTYSYGDVIWRYDGEKWRVTGTSSQPTVQISSGMPAGASDGDAWVDSDDGALYVYYDNFWIAPTVNYALPTSAVNTNQIADGAVTSEKALTSAVSAITGTNSSGVSSALARADHNHAINIGWNTFTPVIQASVTNPTVGTGGIQSGRYFQIGNLVIYQFLYRFGSSGMNKGSGNYRIVLPVSANVSTLTEGAPIGTARLTDHSDNRQIDLNFFIHSNSSYVQMAAHDWSAGAVDVTDVWPWTWAASDQITGMVIYEAA